MKLTTFKKPFFSNQEEIINLDSEITEMKNSNKPSQKNDCKQKELGKTQKDLQLCEGRLRHKENVFAN